MSDKQTRKDRQRELLQPDDFLVMGERLVHGFVVHWRAVVAVVVVAVAVTGAFSLWERHLDGVEEEAAAALYKAESQLPSQDPMEIFQRLQRGETAAPADDSAKLREAVAALEAVATSHGGTVQADIARIEAGAALFELGEYAKAAEHFAAARGTDSELVRHLATQGEGQSLVALEQWDRAIQAFRALRDGTTGPVKEQAWLDLARAHESAGKRDEARALYEEFEKTFPDSKLLATIKGRLASLAAGGGGEGSAPVPAPPATIPPAPDGAPPAGGDASPPGESG